MERSDPTQKAAADPASAKAEPAKPAAEGTPAPDGAGADRQSTCQPAESAPAEAEPEFAPSELAFGDPPVETLSEAEPAPRRQQGFESDSFEPTILETVSFEAVERDEETTQPVWRGAARSEHPAQDVALDPVEPTPREPVEFKVPTQPPPPTPTPPAASVVDYGATAPQLAWNAAVDGIAAPAPHPFEAPARGATRLTDLVQRAARVAALVFGGWLSAVLVLILVFRFVNPPTSTLMALQWMSGTSIQHEWVPLEAISPNLTRAVIVAEDGRFCQHWGVDFVEVAKAIQRATDGYPRGASTITMQVAKNLFLLPVKSYLRKVVEVPLAFAIELAWPKWRILEVYLNIAEWGPGIFGAEAAAQAHFKRPASRLGARQAAQLAVVLPNPIVRDAGSPGPRSAHRAAVIEARAAHEPEAAACIGQQ